VRPEYGKRRKKKRIAHVRAKEIKRRVEQRCQMKN